MTLFDESPCQLGEGPLWHPERQQFFWFDILGKRLLTHEQGQAKSWTFDDHVSAAGWIDREHLLIATEKALIHFNLTDGTRSHLCDLEEDNPNTRSNDGRADPFGGFWIGTMGFDAQKGMGSIYRFYQGELKRLYHDLSIPNAICFSPCKGYAYFTDSAIGKVMRVALDQQGWPKGEPVLFADLKAANLHPDGAVVDRKGNVWIAQWGYHRICAFRPDGTLLHEEYFPASQITCPAFGGPDLQTLYATSASVGLSEEDLAKEPEAGKCFYVSTAYKGQREHQIKL